MQVRLKNVMQVRLQIVMQVQKTFTMLMQIRTLENMYASSENIDEFSEIIYAS